MQQAVLDLDRQQSQLRLGARTLVVDVVMQAPERFCRAYREALESELGSARPVAIRARFHLGEHINVGHAVATLDRLGVGGRASHGVLPKAPDHPDVAAAMRRLASRGIPVVTLVTDIRDSGRVAYVGLDNRSAGATAAYLLDRWLGDRLGDVLVTLSGSTFFGETERFASFRTTLATSTTARDIVALTESEGLDATLRAQAEATLRRHPNIVAGYSIGGGNRAIVDAFAAARRPCLALVGHDLDRDNLGLLQRRSLSVVLHHDLQTDSRRALRQLLRAHRLVRGAPMSAPANVQVITPFNVPGRFGPE